MKIQLPNGEKITLDVNLSLENKKKVVEELTTEYAEVSIRNFNSNTIRFFLDGLGNYLVWHKEEEDKHQQDKEVLSIKRVEQMEGRRKSPSIPFTDLSVTHKELLGLDGAKQ